MYQDVFKNSSCRNALGKLTFVKPLPDFFKCFYKISFIHKCRIDPFLQDLTMLSYLTLKMLHLFQHWICPANVFYLSETDKLNELI